MATHDPGDLEQYAGEEIPDPWDDEAQTDWPNEEVTTDGNILGDDQERGQSPAAGQ